MFDQLYDVIYGGACSAIIVLAFAKTSRCKPAASFLLYNERLFLCLHVICWKENLMKLLKNVMLIGAAAFALSACGVDRSPETKLSAAKKAPQSTPFYNALSKDYLDFAIFEVGQNDRAATADRSLQ